MAEKTITPAQRISQLLGFAGRDDYPALKQLPEELATRFANVLLRPDLDLRYNGKYHQITIGTQYGSVVVDTEHIPDIKSLYVNGQGYEINESLDQMSALEALVGDYDQVISAIGNPIGKRFTGRQMRNRNQTSEEIAKFQAEFPGKQKEAFDDLSKANLDYDNIFMELSGVVQSAQIDIRDIVTDLYEHDIPKDDIPHYLIYESPYRETLVSRMLNLTVPSKEPTYQFETVAASDTDFVGRLVKALGKTEGRYDREKGVLELQEDGYTRKITNLPEVDEKGVFHNQKTAYLPYHIGYFAEGSGSRIDRLRVIDPVERAIDGVRLQYDLTKKGNVKFKTILDVTRNLPDFDNHPYGQEILDTLKHKVVLSKRYQESNSLLAEFGGTADELGAVALTMLDEDAAGVIDPYGTSNGRNLGMIFYLTKDAVINPDGTITPGQSRFSEIGEIIDACHADRDNFNRNQMSFNAMLTSLDVMKPNVFIGEFGMWNMEDALVLTNNMNGTIKVGDKLEDFHGNKGTVSVILGDLTEEQVKERHLENAIQFMKDNPDIDVIASPSSIASRLNMGIVYEGLDGDTFDVTLPDGTTVENGGTQLTYMRLAQTAEHKSKDYGIEGDGRRYSTLFRYALTAKVGDLYKEGFISEEVRNRHIDEVAATFERLGVSFNDDKKLLSEGNVNLFVDAPVTVSVDTFEYMNPSAIRLSLMNQMRDNKINIDLGDMQLNSRFFDGPIQDSQGHNVLPIRVNADGTIPYRYIDIFRELACGSEDKIQAAYDKFSGIDYKNLTDKNNLLKNIDTMTFTTGARTTVIVPDPSIGLNDVRSNVEDTRVVVHRDPAIQCGNVLSMNNVGGAAPNVLHTNPLMINMQDGDYDGDTEGENAYKNINLSEEKKQELFEKSNVTERVNYYGEVKLNTDSADFVGIAKANGMDISDITFADGKSSEELVALVEAKTRQLLDSPKSYGAYPISFTDEQSAKNSLCKLADDGIKGKRVDMERYLDSGYTKEENQALAKALIAKSEWTGLAGATTNKLISHLQDNHNDILRSAMDLSYSMTQSCLQMKKSAEKLPIIDSGIKTMKQVLNGKYNAHDSRVILKEITEGLIPEGVVDTFVDKVYAAQLDKNGDFGNGVINNTETTTMKLAYASAKVFDAELQKLAVNDEPIL